MENRKSEFFDLLKWIKLHRLPDKFLKDILNESLVKDDLLCSNLITDHFLDLFKVIGTKEKQATKIISVGGTNTPRKTFEIYNIFDEPKALFSDLPETYISVVKINNFAYAICDGNVSNNRSKNIFSLELDPSVRSSSMWKHVSLVDQNAIIHSASNHNGTLAVVFDFSRSFFEMQFNVVALTCWVSGPNLDVKKKKKCVNW